MLLHMAPLDVVAYLRRTWCMSVDSFSEPLVTFLGCKCVATLSWEV